MKQKGQAGAEDDLELGNIYVILLLYDIDIYTPLEELRCGRAKFELGSQMRAKFDLALSAKGQIDFATWSSLFFMIKKENETKRHQLKQNKITLTELNECYI